MHHCGVAAGLDAAELATVGKKQRKRLRSPLHWAARHGHLDVCKCGFGHAPLVFWPTSPKPRREVGPCTAPETSRA